MNVQIALNRGYYVEQYGTKNELRWIDLFAKRRF